MLRLALIVLGCSLFANQAQAKLPEFVGTVASVETRDFFRPPENSPSR